MPDDDTWESRDLPLLRAIAQLVEAEPDDVVTTRQAAESIAMGEEDALRALRNLQRGRYVPEFDQRQFFGDVLLDFGVDVTERTLRTVGRWPSEQTALDRMLASLEAIATNTEVPEDERSRARKILAQLAGDGRNLGLTVATAVVTGQVT